MKNIFSTPLQELGAKRTEKPEPVIEYLIQKTQQIWYINRDMIISGYVIFVNEIVLCVSGSEGVRFLIQEYIPKCTKSSYPTL